MDDGVQQTVETPSEPEPFVPVPQASPPVPSQAAAIGDAIGDLLGDTPPGSTMIMARMPELSPPEPEPQPPPVPPEDDGYVPGQTLVKMTMPDEEPTVPGMDAAPPPEQLSAPPVPELEPVSEEQLPSIDVDAVDVDVDTDWGGQAIAVAPAPGQQQFLDRLRANDKLVRRPMFFEYAAVDTEEEHVIGSLMGGDRFEDLKVLSRGQCTPEQLESHLLKFHQLGLIGFDG